MKRGYADYEPLSPRRRAVASIERLRRGPLRTMRLNLVGWSALLACCLGLGLLTGYAVSRLSGPVWLPWMAGVIPLAAVFVIDRRRDKDLRARQIRVRLGAPSDVAAFPTIEKSGDVAFREVGMDLVADADVPDPAAYLTACGAGRLWVACDATDQPIGFIWVEIVDDLPHVEQVSVLPSHAGRHTGARLLSTAAAWARAADYPRMTLRTFVDVPWNGPYYERLGWRVLPDDDCGPQLRSLAETERALGLTQWPRQAMVLDLTGPGVVF
ncbi:MAG TPA: GNAT family N-acetyltransferase [Dermatophilaceae bacterium]|nr:GNAT family N-acetyltransferase [Dermatophilaceae bacterium]